MNMNMMGDFEDVGDDLVDTDSFVNHRGAGEEPFYVPDETDSDSSAEENDLALEWSRADLSAIMDELELMDNYIEQEQKDYDLMQWNIPSDGVANSEDSDDEDRAGGGQAEARGCCNPSWEEWYDYPYGSDFVQDFHCLQNSFDVRNDLLDMLEITDTYITRSDSKLHEEVQEAINDILIPGMSREGLRQLHKIILREPTLNLKKYLVNADPYVLAYIIWGLNFYISCHAKGKWKKNLPRIIECGTQASSVNKEENGGIPNMIYSLGLKLLSWFCDIIKGINIGSGYEDLIRHFSPLIGVMKMNNEVDCISQ